MYNRLFIVIFAVLIQCYCARSTKKPYIVKTIEYNSLREEFVHDFEFLYQEIRDNYVNLAYKENRYNFIWNELYDTYKLNIEDIKTYKDFYKICTEFTAYLHDGHLRFSWIPSREQKRILEDDYIIRKAISLCLIENKVVVSEAVKEDILGFEVLSINDIPLKTIIDYMQKHYYLASDDYRTRVKLLYREKYLHYFNLYYDPFPSELSFKLRNKDGKELQFIVSYRQELYDYSKRYAINMLAKDTASLSYGNIVDNQYGYIKIPTFSGKKGDITGAFKKIINNFHEKGVKGVIIDVRGNGGGNESYREILGYLTSKKIIMNRYRFKDTERFRQLYGRKRIMFENLRSPSFQEHLDEGYTKWWGWKLKPQKEDYLRRVPVVAIYDDRIFSSTIDFVTTCKEFNLATVIGPSMELTNNGFTSPVSLPGGHFSIAYSAMEFRKPDYSYEEYLKPNIEVQIKLDDVYQGKDTLLEAAIAYLNKVIPKV